MTETAESVVTRTAENTVTETVVSTKNGIKWMIARDPMSECKEVAMLWTIFVILVILWLLGLVSGHTIGGFIHVLLVIAIVVVLIRIIQGRRPI
jgi:hypothetical protein